MKMNRLRDSAVLSARTAATLLLLAAVSMASPHNSEEAAASRTDAPARYATAIGPGQPGGRSAIDGHPSADGQPIRQPAVKGQPSVKGKTAAVRPRVALIIDDFGNGMRGTDEMFKLPVKLTVAVMPFLATSQEDARKAHERGDDVLVHLPMQPRHGKAQWLGPGAVLSDLSDEEIRKRVEAAVDHIPYAIGINNHMGSKVTGDERVMRAVLSVCKDRGLFFVDSHTNYRSVVGRVASGMGLPPVENHIFLDDTHTASHVAHQLKLAGQRATDQRYCITIGHVGIHGKETAKGIRDSLHELKDSVQFVGISELVKQEWKWSPQPTAP